MAPLQSGDAQLHTTVAFRGFLLLVVEFDGGIFPSGTADVKFPFVFRVEVDQDVAL